ncbi:MAG TPA: GAF domain-containing protein, partial [Roseiflexaceae bacterium]
MYRDLREEQQRTALLLSATQMTGSSLDLDEVLWRIAHWIAAAVGDSDCGIYLMDSQQRVLVPRFPTLALDRTRLAAFLSHPLDLATNALVREVVERGAPIACPDAAADPRLDHVAIRNLDVKSILAVPIVANDRVLGVAITGSADGARGYSDEQVALASGIAGAVALAVDNAQLYKEVQHRLAESQALQRVTAALLGKHGLAEHHGRWRRGEWPGGRAQ